MRRVAALRPRRRRARPVRRDAGRRSSWPTARSARSSSPWAPARDADEARASSCSASAAPAAARSALEGVWHYWNRTLGAVHVETPDPSLNFLANGWLVYQTLACRLWARSGFYQSGGAFGFRDQLQDAMALVHAEPRAPARAPAALRGPPVPRGRRAALVASAAGRGVRTHFSDDYLWLPLRDVPLRADAPATPACSTRRVQFLEGRPVKPEEESYYDLPAPFRRSRDALRALRARDRRTACSFGEHGLPLMGCGDWNDGMNLVGAARQGRERLARLLPVRRAHAVRRRSRAARGDAPFAERCAARGGAAAPEHRAHGWDGEWYRRAYFDDGTPLGSATNAECQIDSIPQSWSVLSGAGEPRARAHGDGRVDRAPRAPRRRG